MLAVTQILDLYAWVYTDLSIPDGTFDHLLPVDGAWAAIKRIDGTDYILLRGSTTLLDWIQDFQDCALPYNDPVLGDVHPGARDGALLIKDQIDTLVGDHVVFVGHSLGAMHAAILAGYRVAAGKPVDGLVMFGEPRSGGPKLSQILADVPVQSFRNARPPKYPGESVAHDIITDVARSIPPELPYQHVRDLTDCYHEPRADDVWLAFKWHHCGHYARAFGCGGSAALSLPI